MVILEIKTSECMHLCHHKLACPIVKKYRPTKTSTNRRPSMHNPEVFWVRESFGFVYAISLRKGLINEVELYYSGVHIIEYWLIEIILLIA